MVPLAHPLEAILEHGRVRNGHAVTAFPTHDNFETTRLSFFVHFLRVVNVFLQFVGAVILLYVVFATVQCAGRIVGEFGCLPPPLRHKIRALSRALEVTIREPEPRKGEIDRLVELDLLVPIIERVPDSAARADFEMELIHIFFEKNKVRFVLFLGDMSESCDVILRVFYGDLQV